MFATLDGHAGSRAGIERRTSAQARSHRRVVPEPLLHRVAAGDNSAVEACLDRYGGLVWSLARRFSANRHEAEDAVQDVFIELWKKAPRYDASLSSEMTFVAMIARRRLIDRGRRAGASRSSEELSDSTASPTAEADYERVDTSDEAGRAARELQRLKPEQQSVLKLSIFEGLSHQQIADRLSLPLGTVKTHVRRGLERVREALTRTNATNTANEGARP
jgi:RNA polymerase sigma-70 factor (ECF subfamily)